MDTCQLWCLYISPISYALFLVLIYNFFFYRKGKGFMKFIKFPFAFLTILAGLFVYYVGYSKFNLLEIQFKNVLLAIFSTCRLFILGNDLVEISEDVKSCPVFELWFGIVAVSAALISFSVLFNLFGKQLITRYKIRWNSAVTNFIFFGVNDASVSLTEDLYKTGTEGLKVLVKEMDLNENESLYERAEKTSAFLIDCGSLLDKLSLKNEESSIQAHSKESVQHGKIFVKQNYLKRLKLQRKVTSRESHLFFLTVNEDCNVRVAISVINELNQSDIEIKEKIVFYIRTLSEDMENLYYESFPSHSSKIAIRFLNDADIAARQLIKSHCPVDWIEKDKTKGVATSDFNVLVVGFGQTGISALKNLIEFGQFIDSKFKAVAIDKAMNSIAGSFANRYPGLVSNYNIELVETTVGHTYFYDLIKKRLNELDYIIIALGSDALNVQTAYDIQFMVKKISKKSLKILVRLNDNFCYDNLFRNDGHVSVEVFGREKDVFTEEIVIRRSLEESAEKIHYFYNLTKDEDKRQSWDQLTRIKQLSNISVAAHIHTKLVLMGMSIERVKQFETIDQFVVELGVKRLEVLAQTEHLRWNAHLFANGWDTYPLNEIPDGEPNKDEVRKLHACLVSWIELKKVNKRFNDDYYKYDRENVTGIFELVKKNIYDEKQQ